MGLFGQVDGALVCCPLWSLAVWRSDGWLRMLAPTKLSAFLTSLI